MASEITLQTTLTANKANLSITKATSVSADLTDTMYSAGAQTIGTTHELLALGSDTTVGGVAWFRNLDATNYVEIGIVVSATFYPVIKLLASDPPAVIRTGTLSLYAKANTAACNLEYLVLSA